MYMPIFSLPLKFSDFSLRIPKFPLTHCVPAGAPTVTLRTTRNEIRLQLLPIPGNVILPQTGGNMWVEREDCRTFQYRPSLGSGKVE